MQNFKNNIIQKMGNPADLITRDISENCFIMFIKNMTDRRYTSEGIILPLMERETFDSFKGNFESILTCAAVISEDNIDTLITMLLRGSVIVAIKSDRIYTAFCPADTFVGRAVSEPESDVTVRGPKAGFTENGENNVSMLRKIIRTDKLRVEMLSVGKTAQTTIFICYVEGRADQNALKIIRDKLNNFSEEYIIDSANLETVIEGKRSKMFPSMGSTEKVDKAASKLLSGRIGIICDGSPYVLTAPYYFIEAFQSAEDYLKNPWYSSFLRFVRFFAFTLNIYFPAVFIALIYHHSQTFPKKLLDFIHSLEENSAISMFWEMLLMLVLFELIREVGVRMPRTVGDAAGLVGSLILGDAAVEAGISSITIIVIVAISSVSAYITPAFASPAVILRFAMLFAGYFSGLYGIIAVTAIWGVFMLKKKSFGNSYMYPLYPFDLMGMLDYIVVVPKKVLGRKEGEKK